jgi:hypothetical protein
MKRIHIICEGDTEEEFVKELLNHHFSPQQIFFSPRLLGKKGHKGGRVDNQRLFNDIRILLLQDTTAYCTTFFDFYALPANFFGKEQILDTMPIQQKSDMVCHALKKHVSEKLGQNVVRRFIPYVQMHEFEGLLFSDPSKFSEKMALTSNIATELQKIRDSFETPEHINDSQYTAPSKRILKLIRQYQKPTAGLNIAKAIGLPTMRQECPLFNQWLSQLEHLPALE